MGGLAPWPAGATAEERSAAERARRVDRASAIVGEERAAAFAGERQRSAARSRILTTCGFNLGELHGCWIRFTSGIRE
jgi:hypothetical protein